MATGSEGDTKTANMLDLVVKLGGAAITDKSRQETLRHKALLQGAALIKQCHDAGKRVVIVHGAGSFGHHQAKKYSVNEGLKEDRDFHGFCVTRNSVITLNKHVVECLTDQNLPAVACPAFPAWRTCQRAVVQWPWELVESVVAAGLLPVFHGDCVLDSQQGCCILSGDTIIQTLCNHFLVKRVVFLSDVSGVYDKPPSEDGAKLLRHVCLTGSGQLCGKVKLATADHDVTGGMLNKIQSAQNIVAATSGRTRVFVSKIGSKDAEILCTEKDIDLQNLEASEIVNTFDT